MAKFYVYTLAYPSEMGGGVFYVGKGCKGRIKQHEYDATDGTPGRLYDAIRDIWASRLLVVRAKVFETDDEDEAFKVERDYIRSYKSGGLLVNIQGMEAERWRTTLTLRCDLGEKLVALAEQNGIGVNAMIAQLIAHAPDPKKSKAKAED